MLLKGSTQISCLPIPRVQKIKIKTNSLLIKHFAATKMIAIYTRPIFLSRTKTSLFLMSCPGVPLDEKQYWEEHWYESEIRNMKFTYLSLAESWLEPSLDLANSRAFATWVFELVFCPDVPAACPFTNTIFSFGFFSLFWNYKINLHSHKYKIFLHIPHPEYCNLISKHNFFCIWKLF